MPTTRRAFLLNCGGAALAVAAGPLRVLALPMRKEPLAIVVATGSALKSLTLLELKRLYLGEGVITPDGKRLVALHLAEGSAERLGFEQSVLGMRSDELSRYWVDHKIRGDRTPPRTLPGAPELIRIVSRLEGGIGYVPLRSVTREVRAIRIDGKSPGDAGYPVLSSK